jgi:hypothetical protein
MNDILLTVATIFISFVTAWYSASYSFRKNYKEGKMQLLEIIMRYYIVLINAFEKDTRKISESKASQLMYTYGIKVIEEDLRKLITNPYFNNLIEKYPQTSKLLVQLQRSYISLSNSEFSINSDILKLFSEIFHTISPELPRKYLSENPFYTELLEIITSLDQHMKNDFISSNRS